MKRIGIGVIGCGTISDVYLTNIIHNLKNVELLACADMFMEKAEQAAAKYHTRACTVEELLAIEEIQIVLNLTIPAAHYDVNMQILQAGKHLYCEKPLTLHYEDAQKVMALASEKKLMAVSAPDTFLGAGLQTCRALLEQGTIGKPVGFTANMVCPGHELWHPNPGFYYQQGGGPMFDMGPYYLTALVTLLGPIRKIACLTAVGRSERNILGEQKQVEIPTHYAAIVEFQCGAVGNINMSFEVWESTLPCIEIYGTKGSMLVPDPNSFDGKVKVFDSNKLTQLLEAVTEPHPAKLRTMQAKKSTCQTEQELLFASEPGKNMRGLGVSDMAQALLDGRCSRLSTELSLHVVEALNAFEFAAETDSVYEMKTTCTQPEPMGQDWALWEIK